MTNYWAGRTSLLEEALLHERAIDHSIGAGWSSPVARQAHNLKVIGSNPIPATNFLHGYQWDGPPLAGFFMACAERKTKTIVFNGLPGFSRRS
jgi:hypothetical protein